MKKSYFPALKLFLLVFILILFGLSSCKSLPAPESESDCVLVIPIGYEKSSNTDWFGNYSISITDLSTSKTVATKLLPVRKDGFTVVTGLPPGRYKIFGDQFDYVNGKKSSKITIRNIEFELVPGYITVLSKKFVYLMFDKSGKPWMNRKWVNFSASEKKELVETMREYKNFDLWTVN